MYAETPVITENEYGKGTAYFIGATPNQEFLEDFYEAIIKKHKIKSLLNSKIPEGILVQERQKEDDKYLFLSNYNRETKTVKLDKKYYDMLNECEVENEINLEEFDVRVLKTK